MRQKEPLILKQERDFGTLISDLIRFFKENFKDLFHLYVRYGISIMAIGAVVSLVFNVLAPNVVLGSGEFFEMFSMFGGMVIYLPFLLFGMYAVMTAVFGYVEGYEKYGKEEALDHAKQQFWPIAKRLFILTLTMIVGASLIVSVFGGAAALLGGFGVIIIFALYVALIFVFTKLMLWPYIYSIGEMSLTDSMKESYNLTHDRWWWTFGLYFIISMIGSTLMYIFMIPLYLLMMVPILAGGDFSEVSNFGNYGLIAMFLMFAGYLIFGLFLNILIPFMYYSLFDRKYGESIETRIGNVKYTRDSLFENEGEV